MRDRSILASIDFSEMNREVRRYWGKLQQDLHLGRDELEEIVQEFMRVLDIDADGIIFVEEYHEQFRKGKIKEAMHDFADKYHENFVRKQEMK